MNKESEREIEVNKKKEEDFLAHVDSCPNQTFLINNNSFLTRAYGRVHFTLVCRGRYISFISYC